MSKVKGDTGAGSRPASGATEVRLRQVFAPLHEEARQQGYTEEETETRIEEAREENITPHSTRHTCITLALDEGAPLHKVHDVAGHADPRTTERYWRTKQNLDDSAVDYVRL